MSNGVFANAKRFQERSPQFEDVPTTNATARGFRKFMGEDGVARLSLSALDRDLTGDQVWGDDEGYTGITHEIFD